MLARLQKRHHYDGWVNKAVAAIKADREGEPERAAVLREGVADDQRKADESAATEKKIASKVQSDAPGTVEKLEARNERVTPRYRQLRRLRDRAQHRRQAAPPLRQWLVDREIQLLAWAMDRVARNQAARGQTAYLLRQYVTETPE